jgi:plastocyanin
LGGFFLLNAGDDTSNETQNTTDTNTDTTPPTENNNPPAEGNNNQTGDQTQGCREDKRVTVTYNGSGFSPSSAQLEVCENLVWSNNSSSQVEIGVDPHPVHSGDKEITDGQFSLMVGPGESKTVVVEKAGTFNYHNHLDSGQTGTIVVRD